MFISQSGTADCLKKLFINTILLFCAETSLLQFIRYPDPVRLTYLKFLLMQDKKKILQRTSVPLYGRRVWNGDPSVLLLLYSGLLCYLYFIHQSCSYMVSNIERYSNFLHSCIRLCAGAVELFSITASFLKRKRNSPL